MEGFSTLAVILGVRGSKKTANWEQENVFMN